MRRVFKKMSMVVLCIVFSLPFFPNNLLAANYTESDFNIITDVQMLHSNGTSTIDNNRWESWETIKLKLKFDLGYPKKISSGDKYSFYLPEAFKTFSSSPTQYTLYALDENGARVPFAKVTLYPTRQVVMDFSIDNGFIDSHDDITGEMNFNVKFSETYAGENIEFSNNTEVQVDFVPSQPTPPTTEGGESNSLLKSAAIVDNETRIMKWTLKISSSQDVNNAYVIDQAQDQTHSFVPYFDGIDPQLEENPSNITYKKWNAFPSWDENNWYKNVAKVRFYEGVVDGDGNPVYDLSGKQKKEDRYEFIEIEPLSYDENGNITAFKIPLGDIKNIAGYDTDILIDYYTQPIDASVLNYYNGATFIGDGTEFKGTGMVAADNMSGIAVGTIRYLSLKKVDDQGHTIFSNDGKFKVEKLDGASNVTSTQMVILTDGIANFFLLKGEYRITEIEAPVGYELLAEPMYILVDDSFSTNINLRTSLDFTNYKTNQEELLIKKIWQDDELHNNTDEYIEVLIYQDSASNSVEYLRKKIFAKDNWEYQLTNLPTTNSQGEPVTYRIEEINTPAGYLVEIKEDTVNNQVLIYNKKDLRNISVSKVWKDDNNYRGLRPEGVRVQLKADGVNYEAPIELNEGNNWTYTWENLGEKIGGIEIDYSIEEVDVPSEYTVSVIEDDTDNIIVENQLISNESPMNEVTDTSSRTMVKIPKTGHSWLLVSSIGVLTLGLILIKKAAKR